jgi:hypothetical protein
VQVQVQVPTADSKLQSRTQPPARVFLMALDPSEYSPLRRERMQVQVQVPTASSKLRKGSRPPGDCSSQLWTRESVLVCLGNVRRRIREPDLAGETTPYSYDRTSLSKSPPQETQAQMMAWTHAQGH